MRIAGIQMDVELGQPKTNLKRILHWLEQAADAGAELVIFPECAVTGYSFDSRSEAVAFAEPIGGQFQQTIIQACDDLELKCIVGLLEQDEERLFNCAVMMGPEGVIASYRKVHLPYIGVDRWADYGDRPFAVDEVDGCRIGMNICYDAGFPEVARVLALLGADLIALPTNWPPGAECLTPATISARSVENKVYYAAVNRVGLERGTQFIGRSCICAPNGEILASADPTTQTMMLAEINPTIARNKHIVRHEGTHEIDRMADRRPEFYKSLTEATGMTTPRQRLHPE